VSGAVEAFLRESRERLDKATEPISDEGFAIPFYRRQAAERALIAAAPSDLAVLLRGWENVLALCGEVEGASGLDEPDESLVSIMDVRAALAEALEEPYTDGVCTCDDGSEGYTWDPHCIPHRSDPHRLRADP
jgi:hypothetical protein